ncbi:MAG: methionyl-tRNA formyltransferase [Deltaproteobacteria bacterium]|nr:methionyl-tRNA formyltransferase [Deltaproteobacteria bacterium]
MGTPRFAVPSLIALIEAGYDLAAVVTRPDKPRGRGLATLPSPVKEAALERGIRVLEPRNIRDESFIKELRSIAPAFIVVVAYGKILPPFVLGIPYRGCINLHASILPRYRGAAPINRAIVNGDKETGVSTMLMDAGMDTGPVLLAERVAIGDNDTAEDLDGTLSTAGARLLVETIGLLAEGRITGTPQDDRAATYAPTLKKEDGRIDWAKSASEVKNLMRGLYPWPGAYTVWKGMVLKIHSGNPGGVYARGDNTEPGTVIDVTKDSIIVKCGGSAFEITGLQPENRKKMGAGDFIKGYRIKKGDVLGR